MHLALYVMLCLIWGSTWLVIKVGYGGLGPFNVAAVRFLIAGVVLVPIVPLLGARWPSTRAEWMLVVWVGLVLFAADYGLIYWGEQFLDSGMTSILFALLPLVTIGFAHLYVPGDRITGQSSPAACWPSWESSRSSAIAFVSIRRDSGRCWPSSPAPCARPQPASRPNARRDTPSGRAQRARHAHWCGALAVVSLAAGEDCAATGHCDVDRDRVPRDCGQRDHVSRLLHAAEDVERHEPELHQRVHAGDCVVSWIRVPR